MQHEQRLAALAVCRVLDGATLPAALAAVADGAPTRGHALVQELAYGTLRHWGRVDALVQALAGRRVTPPILAALVAIALYQLDHTQAPAFAVVDRAVDAAALVGRPQAKALVNALLRRYLREREALNREVAAASPVARWSYPRWWIGRVEADLPQHWQAVLAAGNERPPLTLRVNLRATTRSALADKLRAAGHDTTPIGEAGLVLAAPRPVAELPGFAEGEFAVQDAGAQHAAPLLAVRDGMRVLDACAAPGGKATHVAEIAAVDLTALDSDEARLARVRDNFERLRLAGPSVRTVAGDAGAPGAWWDGRGFDRILADVPCTASGVVRRHPDAKWLRRRGDVASFGAQQARILAGLWPLLAPGGRMLYTTCSVFAAENELQIKDFLGRTPSALRESISFPAGTPHVGGQLLPSANGAGHNQDGFFYALLRKA
ncbi:MAG: 16S rRNA (cytosine(967)-C(5))-methyltransferase RsmB [Burkholderiales bacterium]|jgi:16S rRNA (cytosine967-C5)-methyltransferase|nr:16S rRNA (cytosine(967)-C(5))-methyltransferase RsmB [Burkholderiales bacterium]